MELNAIDGARLPIPPFDLNGDGLITTMRVPDREEADRMADPADPRPVGYARTPGLAWNVSVAGRWAYVADDDAGVQVIDVHDPTCPRLRGAAPTSGYAWGVAASGSGASVLPRSSRYSR
mgnify:CR=1 FL=1